jgi:hypothetical protein
VFAIVSISQQHVTWQSIYVGDVYFSPQYMCSSSPHSNSVNLPIICLHNGSTMASLLSPLKLCDMSKPSLMHPRFKLLDMSEPPKANP